MAEYSKKPQILIKRGMNLTLPGDRLSQDYFQYLQNVRSYLIGEWRQRPGTSLQYATPDAAPVYLNARVNDNIVGTFRRFVGTSNGNVYIDDVTHSNLNQQVDSGFSGKRYSPIVSRPDRSPKPFLFLGSDNRNSKFSTTGARTEWGLAAPVSPPDADYAGLNYAQVANFNPGVTSAVASSGTPSIATRVAGGTSIFGVFYDSGNVGMAEMTPSNSVFSGVQEGMIVRATRPDTAFEDVIVAEVFLPIAPTAITAIAYDSGNTGLCTIQLGAPSPGLKRNCIVSLNTGGAVESVRVLSVTRGLNGIPSFRCSTANTHVTGESVQGQFAFRAYFTLSHTSASTISSRNLAWNGIAAGLQTLTQSGLLNLAVANVSAGGLEVSRPIQGDDVFHISVLADFSAVGEMQVQFDIDNGNYNRNYFFIAIRKPDLQGVYSQTVDAVTAQKAQVDRQQLDQFVESVAADRPSQAFIIPDDEDIDTDLPSGPGGRLRLAGRPRIRKNLGNINRPTLDNVNVALNTGINLNQGSGPVSVQTTEGALQWKEFFIPISQFQRFGSGIAGWKDVQSFRITANVISSTSINIDAMWIGGCHGPNTIDLPEYTYAYRARNSSTGSRSNLSPPTRYTTGSKRRVINVTVPSYSDTQADVIDIFRLGGTLQSYQLVGTISSATTLFQDDLRDDLVVRNPHPELNRFKPWPTPDLPRSGICNVTGTSVTRVSGDLFNTSWVRGTQIIIGGTLFTLYTNPSSSNSLALNESSRSQFNVTFQIPEPLLDGQPLPAVFGPYSGAAGEFIFGCGDPLNPGFLYWTNGNDPESASDANFIELCPPSEKLMNGVVLDGVVYCYSDKRSWRVLPSFQGGQSSGGSDFYPQETAMGKGLAGRYGLAVGDAIYFVSFDGIYRTRGDVLESLTDESMAPLFRRDGANTSFSAPVSPMDFNFPDEISLTYSFDGLYLTYQGQDSNRYTFYMSFLTRGWMLDSVGGDSIIRSFRELRTQDADNVLVGTSSGRVLLRSNSQFTDAGTSISCRIWDREEIWEDQGLRITKQVGDLIVDSNPNGATLVPTLRYENNTSNDVLSNITGSGRGQTILDVNSGSGRIVRGAALDLTWNNGTSAFPQIYAWEPWALVKPDKSISRATDWENGGYPGTKWLQGFRFKGDSFGINKAFQVEIDGGTFVQSFTFNGSGEQVQTFWLATPIVAHEFRIRGIDSTVWRNFGVDWIFEPEPEQAAVWETQVTSLDMPFFHHIREVMIAHLSTTDITMVVTTDGVSNTYTIPNGGGVRKRSYLPLLPVKAKLDKFRFTSTSPFGLWIRDIEVRAGPWGRTDMYRTLKPFGDVSRLNGGARV